MAFLTVTLEVFLILDVTTLLGKGNTDMAFQHVDFFPLVVAFLMISLLLFDKKFNKDNASFFSPFVAGAFVLSSTLQA